MIIYLFSYAKIKRSITNRDRDEIRTIKYQGEGDHHMKRLIIVSIMSLFIGMAGSTFYFTQIQTKNLTEEALAQQRMGLMIQELQMAIQTPTDQHALDVIYQYGTDSRYYLMVRGWLVQSLNGVESQLQVQQSAPKKAQLSLHAQALKSAIRSIDLE
jgi:hypothetical protein